jgi:hypothetical protein
MNISNFINALCVRLNEYKVNMGLTYFEKYEVIATEGKKFFKVLSREIGPNMSAQHTRIVAFVDKNTGDIFKPASFNVPAKHARGNINSESHGMEAISPEGNVYYLR